MSQSFTTGQVARRLDVCTRTIAKLCDQGLIRSWKIPGSKHRRIPRDAVLEFLKSAQWPEEMIRQFE